jgi:hypothetical protein
MTVKMKYPNYSFWDVPGGSRVNGKVFTEPRGIPCHRLHLVMSDS